MIVSICLNAAIDVTYTVPRLVPGSSHAVEGVRSRSGGKAVNTARVLAQLGEPVTLCGFAGGARGIQLRAGLEGTGVVDALTGIAGETRQSIAVFAEGDATVFNEPGPRVSEAEWAALLDDVAAHVSGASAVVISGSVPPGIPEDGYAQLTKLSRDSGVPVVLDAAGRALLEGLAAEPEIVAPNRGEAAAALGLGAADRTDRFVEAAALSALSHGAAVISDGARGIVATADGRRWVGEPPAVVSGNPTGAGDALNAGLVLGLARGSGLPESIQLSLALATAAVLSPVAGEIDPAVYRDLVSRTFVKEI
jgi:tagatose 6-phosphate kinase